MTMADRMTAAQRHRCMSHIRGRDTGPEIIVRKALHASGFRYRLHVRKLPGTPDIVLKKYNTIIMVNGCFWHGHKGCSMATKPLTHSEFWQEKIRRNRERDEIALQYLEALGWNVITVWECSLKTAQRQSTLGSLMMQIRQNGIDHEHNLALRRFRTMEHHARLKAHEFRT